MRKQPLIGKQAVVRCGSHQWKGVIRDETKFTLVLQTERGPKRLLKHLCVLTVGGKTIHGKDITFRPENRIKK